jgi:hypothetical protein
MEIHAGYNETGWDAKIPTAVLEHIQFIKRRL